MFLSCQYIVSQFETQQYATTKYGGYGQIIFQYIISSAQKYVHQQ